MLIAKHREIKAASIDDRALAPPRTLGCGAVGGNTCRCLHVHAFPVRGLNGWNNTYFDYEELEKSHKVTHTATNHKGMQSKSMTFKSQL